MSGERPLPEDIADLVCCWVIDFLNVSGLPYWDEGPCVKSMTRRMAPFLAHQKRLEAENECRFQMQADRDAARAEVDSLRKQLSDQADEISMLSAEAEMWQQRAEIAEAQLAKEADRE